ncbi:hypothetical protein Pan3_42 [Pseudanabaena phage Pan3]|nr:hypothetical protein Pan3_42 [Pseudanabaena phage Pan3]
MSNDIPHWAKVRACELVNAELKNPGFWEVEDVDDRALSASSYLRALARYIAQHEPEPVDPDLELAREAVAAVWTAQGCDMGAAEVLQGKYDDKLDMKSAFRAIKLVRERGE